MNQYCKYLFITLMLISLGAILSAQEFRGGVEYSKELSENINTDIKYQLRDNFNTDKNYTHLLQSALSYSLTKKISLSGSYRYAFGRESSKNELEDNAFEKSRLTAGITIKSKRLPNDIKLYNRFRYQYSWGNNEKNKQYLRNRVKLDYKLSNNTRPFISIEPYYHITDKTINKFRTSLGSKFQLRHNEIEIFIITEAKLKDSGLTTSHFVGFTYSL